MVKRRSPAHKVNLEQQSNVPIGLEASLSPEDPILPDDLRLEDSGDQILHLLRQHGRVILLAIFYP